MTCPQITIGLPVPNLEIQIEVEFAIPLIDFRIISVPFTRCRKFEIAVIEQVRLEFFGIKRVIRKDFTVLFDGNEPSVNLCRPIP